MNLCDALASHEHVSLPLRLRKRRLRASGVPSLADPSQDCCLAGLVSDRNGGNSSRWFHTVERCCFDSAVCRDCGDGVMMVAMMLLLFLRTRDFAPQDVDGGSSSSSSATEIRRGPDDETSGDSEYRTRRGRSSADAHAVMVFKWDVTFTSLYQGYYHSVHSAAVPNHNRCLVLPWMDPSIMVVWVFEKGSVSLAEFGGMARASCFQAPAQLSTVRRAEQHLSLHTYPMYGRYLMGRVRMLVSPLCLSVIRPQFSSLRIHIV